MALERFLVVLKESVSPQATDEVVSIITNIGGKVEMVLREQKVIIATFDNSFTDRIRKATSVKLVGGVTIGKRQLTRERILKQ